MIKVFDPTLWQGKDVGDNSQFWKHAEVIRVYCDREGRLLADVRFLHDNRISKGHFI